MADEEDQQVELSPLEQIEIKYAAQLEELNAEYSELTEKMAQLGTSFAEQLAVLKAENTPETHSKIDSLHVKSRVRRNLYEELLQSKKDDIERILIVKHKEAAAAQAAMDAEAEE